MYISVIDFLSEVKSKFYIIIAFLILFLAVSFGFNYYKSKILNFEVSINLLKVLSLNTDGYSPLNFLNTLKWIDTQSEIFFKSSLKKNDNYIMSCQIEDMLKCRVKANLNGDLNEFKNKISNYMINSINSAIEEYRDYNLKSLDAMILMNENRYNFMLKKSDESLSLAKEEPEYMKSLIEQYSNESYNISITKEKLDKSMIYKKQFVDAINNSKINKDEVISSQYQSSLNYILIIISSLICGLFAIFLQMKVKD